MQKLSEKLSSCFTKIVGFSQGIQQIEFVFFWCFYDFLQILQESTKLKSLFKMQISNKSLEVFDSLQTGPCLAFRPLEQ
jgi:hypothetical protein